MSRQDHRSVAPTAQPPRGDTVLELDEVARAYGTETAVEDLSLAVRDGELLTLLGPSGCGKTTTLRLIAGLEQPTAGEVRIAGDPVATPDQFVSPERRDVGLVFQDYALFPHLTVAENVAFGLQDRSARETDQRVEELLELVRLTDHSEKRPGQLSGGQKQRVALARSLAPEPAVLLLDEPFSNLDVRLRVKTRREVRRILDAAGVTAISVTHDQEEALSISDRVAVINDGQLEQVGQPAAVFERPESRFVAGFLGRTSFLPGTVAAGGVETALGRVSADDLHGSVTSYTGAAVDVLVRPDDLSATPTSPEQANGRVVDRQYTGPSIIYRVAIEDGPTVRCLHNHSMTIARDQPVSVAVSAAHPLAWYPAAIE